MHARPSAPLPDAPDPPIGPSRFHRTCSFRDTRSRARNASLDTARLPAFVAALLLALTAATPALAQNDDPATASPETLLRALYERISFEAGATPDWNSVRPLFEERAILSFRTARDRTRRLDRDEFIALFQSDIEQHRLSETGFAESIVGLHVEPFGEIAWARVVYEARRLTGERMPQRGVDLFLLVKTDAEWRIQSIVNELPNAERPIPSDWLD